jgi:uncharacterized membrane protein YphA (DoxX/SURF4 family)
VTHVRSPAHDRIERRNAIEGTLATRLASVPLVIDMLVAIATTKLPMLFKSGFWAMAHEARTDWSMLLGATFLFIVGGGSWSIDAWLTRKRNQRD